MVAGMRCRVGKLTYLRSRFVSGFSVAGVADPGRGAERLSERLLSRGQDTRTRFWIRGLRDVAWRPIMKAGTNVPSYSGGLAAA
jgi:hypothetical protein